MCEDGIIFNQLTTLYSTIYIYITLQELFYIFILIILGWGAKENGRLTRLKSLNWFLLSLIIFQNQREMSFILKPSKLGKNRLVFKLEIYYLSLEMLKGDEEGRF